MEALTRVLADAYGLGACRVEPIDYGIWEENFSVRTPKERLFAKRFWRRDRRRDMMLSGLHLGQTLLARGIPAPRLVWTMAGDALAEADGAIYQVAEWIEGRSYHPGELPPRAAGPLGSLLGKLHRLLGPGNVAPARPLPPPHAAAEQCRALLRRYRGRQEPFAATARAILQEQIVLLETVPAALVEHLPRPRLGGPCFNAFWVEQVLFRPDGEVAALVDWTDGAGVPACWVNDLDTCIHLTVFDRPGLAAFVAGYQAEHPLPESEWRALAAGLCYGHLASTNYLPAWLDRPYRRMAHWEALATLWHGQIPDRFRARADVEATILSAVRGP